MVRRTVSVVLGSLLLSSAACTDAMADGILGLYNPLGLYAGAGLGRSNIDQTQYDYFTNNYHRLDGEPLGWNAVIGIRPIPFIGAEADFIDFGTSHLRNDGGDAHDRAAGVFALGFLPVPLPFLEPYAKLGWAQIWEHDRVGGADYTNRPSGVGYGGGVQFHFSQLAIRAEYERISGSHSYGGWNDPSLLSVGLNWTF